MALQQKLIWATYFLIRIGRSLLDLFSSLVGSLTYGSQKNTLPTIEQPILLMSVLELADKIRKQQITAEEVINAYIQRIRIVNPFINAVVEDNFQDALNEAKAADNLVRKCGESSEELVKSKPLLGVPFTVKNSIAVKGLPWNAGNTARVNAKAEFDSSPVRYLREAGAILLVISNVPELCMWFDSYNVMYGGTRNPYDLSRIPGGSSGGEAALIASAASVMGIGNDVGGSLRFPAFFCGIFSHKPTSGLVPMDFTYPQPMNEIANYACAGPLCRYSKDIKPLMKILTGRNNARLRLDETVDFGRIKFLYITDLVDPMISPVQPEIKESLNKIYDHFRIVHRSTVERIEIPLLNEIFVIWMSALRVVDSPTFAELMTDCKGEANLFVEFAMWAIRRPRHTLPVLLFSLGEKMAPAKNSHGYKYVLKKLSKLRSQFQEVLSSNEDVVLFMPTFPEVAPYHNETLLKSFNASYAFVFNLLGLPVTQCPIGTGKHGMPIGVQIASGEYRDHLTIAVAEEIETCFGGWRKP